MDKNVIKAGGGYGKEFLEKLIGQLPKIENYVFLVLEHGEKIF